MTSPRPVYRMPPIPPEEMTEAQKAAAAELFRTRKRPVFGPFVPLLRSPELMVAAKNMGEYLRYNSVLPLKISEFVILITARQWSQQLEWHIHCPIAIEAGVDPAVAGAVRDGRRPDSMSDDEALVWEFSMELHNNRSVSDATYGKVVARFGEQGAIDLAGINGYYSFLAMVMNTARTALPPGMEPPLPAFP